MSNSRTSSHAQLGDYANPIRLVVAATAGVFEASLLEEEVHFLKTMSKIWLDSVVVSQHLILHDGAEGWKVLVIVCSSALLISQGERESRK